ncbi:MAG: Thiamine pyrophosphokinase [Firmicutes bacterium ADurb.Bin356]|nr:MAG: Thiamine pyrophosphokinase [Firmicutes bacterium ADurb.Bin356]
MERLIIFTAYLNGSAKAAYTPKSNDFVLCADSGYIHAQKAGIRPNLVIGDFDSLKSELVPENLRLLAPKEKDDTDTMLCIRYALDKGYKQGLLIGGIGGRFDHTFSNLQALAFAHYRGLQLTMCDEFDSAFLLSEGEHKIEQKEGYALSLFSFSERCSGVTVKGVKYPLNNAELVNTFPLGVSNEFLDNKARIFIKSGLLLAVLSRLEGGR